MQCYVMFLYVVVRCCMKSYAMLRPSTQRNNTTRHGMARNNVDRHGTLYADLPNPNPKIILRSPSPGGVAQPKINAKTAIWDWICFPVQEWLKDFLISLSVATKCAEDDKHTRWHGIETLHKIIFLE